MKIGPLRLALITLLLVLTYWGCTVVAERTVPTLLLTYFLLPQFWLLLTVPVLAVCLWRREPSAAVTGALALAVNLLLLGWVPPHAGAHASPTFRVMTYNLAHGLGGAAPVARTVAAQQPDVLCLQEVNGLEPAFFGALRASLPGYTLIPSREIAVLSRLPVTAWHEEPLPGTGRQILNVTLRAGGQPVTLLNVHFTTVLLRQDWRQARDARALQLAAVLQREQAAAGPFLACGDFNTPPRGQVYSALRSRLVNAFEQAGVGAGYSFPAALPLVRIDHVWLRGGRAVRAFVPVSRASDHRPLVVDVALR